VSDPIDPSKLLEQAKALAGMGAPAGRPKTINHRRAVSSAYYALFHEVNLTAARHILPAGAEDEEIWGVTRWVNHGDVRAVCEAVVACAGSSKPLDGLPKGLSPSAEPVWRALSRPDQNGTRTSSVSLRLRFVAAAFVSLHTARQEADYDHSASFAKETTVGHVEASEVAINFLREEMDGSDFARLSAWIIARASGFKQR
jgi:hypothetical protein